MGCHAILMLCAFDNQISFKITVARPVPSFIVSFSSQQMIYAAIAIQCNRRQKNESLYMHTI